jgi:RNA polymerase sporulation-specific sigma factor
LAEINSGTDYYDRFEGLTDEQLLGLIHEGDLLAQEYLIEKYKGLVRMKTRSYFMLGADREDIIQEGMIGLYKAIRDFKVEKQANFYSFAELCIVRQIITAIKTASRQKHIPLNSYMSLNRSVYDENDECTYIELLSYDLSSNPEAMVIDSEEKSNIEKRIAVALSPLERSVLSFYLRGKSYTEIAEKINKDEKSIDNALQRVKKKVEKIIKETLTS